MEIVKKVLIIKCCVCGVVSESNLVIEDSENKYYCKHHTPTP
jgi:hypothetical protein